MELIRLRAIGKPTESDWGSSMYSADQFAALEIMCRERATLAEKEMEYAETEYWLAEAEEWKRLKESESRQGCSIASGPCHPVGK